MPKYSEYPGEFNCQTCKAVVDKARFYYSSSDLTWLCVNSHMSKVNLYTKGY
jgi:hypothetical protein